MCESNNQPTIIIKDRETLNKNKLTSKETLFFLLETHTILLPQAHSTHDKMSVKMDMKLIMDELSPAIWLN